MRIDAVFISINAEDFDAQTRWWETLLGRPFERRPMPSCHEWTLREGVIFQVLRNMDEVGKTAVTLHVDDLDREIERLRAAGVEAADPEKVEGFETLRFATWKDPEGNTVGLLDGQ